METLQLQKLSIRASNPIGINEHAEGKKNGLQFYSSVTLTIPAGCIAVIPTGWEIALPKMSYGKIRLVSGIHLSLMNDALPEEYCGSMEILLQNNSNRTLYIIEGQPLFILTILSFKPMPFYIVNGLVNKDINYTAQHSNVE